MKPVETKFVGIKSSVYFFKNLRLKKRKEKFVNPSLDTVTTLLNKDCIAIYGCVYE